MLQNKTSHTQEKDLSCGNLFKLWQSHACLKFSHYCYVDVFLLPPTLWIKRKPVFSTPFKVCTVQAFLIEHAILPLHILSGKEFSKASKHVKI